MDAIRKEEARSITKAMFMKAVNAAVYFASPVMASFALFTVYWLEGHTFTLSNTYFVMALLYVLRGPLEGAWACHVTLLCLCVRMLVPLIVRGFTHVRMPILPLFSYPSSSPQLPAFSCACLLLHATERGKWTQWGQHLNRGQCYERRPCPKDMCASGAYIGGPVGTSKPMSTTRAVWMAHGGRAFWPFAVADAVCAQCGPRGAASSNPTPQPPCSPPHPQKFSNLVQFEIWGKVIGTASAE